MAFVDEEVGSATGRPIEIYIFIGSNNTYRITSAERTIVSNGESYEPWPISRQKLQNATHEDDNASLEITLPFDHPMVKEYILQNSPPELSVELRQAHRSNLDDTVSHWKGKVTGITLEGRIAKIKAPSNFSFVFNGTSPVPRYQAPCNHVLYDKRCQVDELSNSHETSIVSVSGVDVKVSTLPFADDDAKAGTISNAAGEVRMIISQVGTTLSISFPFGQLAVGDAVTVKKGCDHSFTTCKAKFANQQHFGGFPMVPNRNPFTSNIRTN